MNSDKSKPPQKSNDSVRIKRVTQSIIGLPTLPTVVSKMLEMIDNPRTSASSLARLISQDQALTAKILKLANSAYYGFSREISTVNMAIVVLGFNTVKDMGLWLSVFDVFKKSSDNSDFDIVRFWEHSIACGVAARMIAKHSRSRYAGEAFVAGLLHDIGKVVLNQYFHQEFIDILQLAQSTTLEAAEAEVLGLGHGRIGAWLAEKWNLPSLICDSILYHHQPWNAKEKPEFVAIVTLGDMLCHLTETGYSGRSSCPEYNEEFWEIFANAGLSIDEPDLDNFQTEFLIEYERSDAFITMLHENS